ncbi:MAG TPA: transglutaminase domain-containing protein, partial [Firmicutes bacterium]|nr:transglutaminase domain-containing protein [Bacillota bacterium]
MSGTTRRIDRALRTLPAAGALYASFLALTASLADAMGVNPSLPGPLPAGLTLAGIALGVVVAAFLVVLWPRWMAAGAFLTAAAGLVALWLTGNSGWEICRQITVRGAGWLARGVRALVSAWRGESVSLTPDLAWAGVLLPLFILALLVGSSWRQKRDPFWILAVGAALPVLEWFSYFERALHYLTLYLVASLTYLAAWRALNRSRVRALNQPLSPLRSTIWATLLAVTAVVLARAVPASYPTITPSRMADWVTETIPGLRALRGPGGKDSPFDLAMVGFNSQPRALGGPVQQRSGTALTVKVLQVRYWPREDVSVPSLYLRGTILAQYTGHTWRHPLLPSPSPSSAAGDAGAALLGATIGSRWLDVALEITAKDLRTSTLFSPWIPLRVLPQGQTAPGKTTMDPLTGELRSSPPFSTYRVEARVPLPTLSELKPSFSGEQQDLDLFLQLPPGLPARVKDLAQRLTEKARTPYEQVQAVVTYLRSLPYDPQVPAPDPGQDFVDDFLFNLRRGYCVHHSTALAVMLRTLGIPSRWVQGFAVRLPADRLPPDDTSPAMGVPHATAHAWVEVFLPGWGWTVCDPTPRFQPLPAAFPPLPSAADHPSPGNVEPEPSRPSLRQPSRELYGEEATVSPSLPSSRRPTWVTYLVMVVAASASASLIRGTVRAASLARQERSRKGEETGTYTLRQYLLAQRYLALQGKVRAPWQTPREFLATCRAALDPEALACLAALTDGVEQALYGPRRPSPFLPSPVGGSPVPPLAVEVNRMAATPLRRWA